MFYAVILACATGFLSASSIYSNKEEPNLYEEVFYSDSSPDENVAAMNYFRKREAEEESSDDGWNFTPWVYGHKDFSKFCTHLLPSKPLFCFHSFCGHLSIIEIVF